MERQSCKEQRIGRVRCLQGSYTPTKDIIGKHTCLCKAIGSLSDSEKEPLHQLEIQAGENLLIWQHGRRVHMNNPLQPHDWYGSEQPMLEVMNQLYF